MEEELTDYLREEGHDAYAEFDDATNANVRYLTRLESTSRPCLALRKPETTVLLALSSMDAAAAERSDAVDDVRTRSEYAFREKLSEVGFQAAYVEVFDEFLTEFEVRRLAVPEEFPYFVGRELDDAGYDLHVARNAMARARAVKSRRERELIREAQRAAESAMAAAEQFLRDCAVRGGELRHDGAAVTADRVRIEVKRALVEADCRHPDPVVVLPGEEGGDPYADGEGVLRANAPILVDVSPRHASGYYGDVSRTFCRGTPSDEARAMYEATRAAQQAGLDALSAGAGVTGAAVHEAICEQFEERGYPTEADADHEGPSYVPSASGHGIGLEGHESLPALHGGGGELSAGNAITIEPGLYDPNEGGVRIEDLVVVTEDGYRNLTEYEKAFVV